MNLETLFGDLQCMQKAINGWFDQKRRTLKALLDLLVNSGDHTVARRTVDNLDRAVARYYEKRTVAHKMAMLRTLEWFRRAEIELFRDPMFGPEGITVDGETVMFGGEG